MSSSQNDRHGHLQIEGFLYRPLASVGVVRPLASVGVVMMSQAVASTF